MIASIFGICVRVSGDAITDVRYIDYAKCKYRSCELIQQHLNKWMNMSLNFVFTEMYLSDTRLIYWWYSFMKISATRTPSNLCCTCTYHRGILFFFILLPTHVAARVTINYFVEKLIWYRTLTTVSLDLDSCTLYTSMINLIFNDKNNSFDWSIPCVPYFQCSRV